jgi:hypothetical protein
MKPMNIAQIFADRLNNHDKESKIKVCASVAINQSTHKAFNGNLLGLSHLLGAKRNIEII